jgi:hypothetical protein
MNKQQSNWVQMLGNLIAAKKNHAVALRGLLAHHDNKRTLALVQDIVTGLRIAFPQTDACESVYAGQPVVSFPKKGSGFQFYRDEIAPLLPKLRKSTSSKRNQTDPVEAAIKRLRSSFTTAQLRRIAAAL